MELGKVRGAPVLFVFDLLSCNHEKKKSCWDTLIWPTNTPNSTACCLHALKSRLRGKKRPKKEWLCPQILTVSLCTISAVLCSSRSPPVPMNGARAFCAVGLNQANGCYSITYDEQCPPLFLIASDDWDLFPSCSISTNTDVFTVVYACGTTRQKSKCIFLHSMSTLHEYSTQHGTWTTMFSERTLIFFVTDYVQTG